MREMLLMVHGIDGGVIKVANTVDTDYADENDRQHEEVVVRWGVEEAKRNSGIHVCSEWGEEGCPFARRFGKRYLVISLAVIEQGEDLFAFELDKSMAGQWYGEFDGGGVPVEGTVVYAFTIFVFL